MDGYDKKNNIVFEYDEPRHYDVKGRLREDDVKRMIKIKKFYKCKFIRYNEKDKKITWY